MTNKLRTVLSKYKPHVQTIQKTDAVKNHRPVIVKPVKYKPKADEVVVNLPGRKPVVVKKKNEVVTVDNRNDMRKQLDQKKNEQIRQYYQQQKNNQAFEDLTNSMMKLYSPSTYVGAAARSLTGDGTFGSNLTSGTGFNDPVANIAFDIASPFILKSGVSALNKYALTPTRNLLRNRAASSVLNRNIRNWDGTVGEEYFHSPYNWYRWTETPEIQSLRRYGKNITTEDSYNLLTGGTPDAWRRDAMKNRIWSRDGYWYKKLDQPEKTIALKRKPGSSHGNRSQAAYGTLWDGGTSTSGIGHLGVLEGGTGVEIPTGTVRSFYTTKPVDKLRIGQRVGFQTGEMPTDNLSWFEKLPNGRFAYKGVVLPDKRIDLTPKTHISKEEVDVPFKGKLQDYITESGESMIYDDGQYVLKEKSLYDVNSSIDKLHQNVSRDLAMNQIPGVQPIEYLGYKVNTNPQKVINGLTGKVETRLNKTYDPIYRQRKLIPLDDPKTKIVYQPNPYRLLDRWGIKHDKDFGYVNDITFSDFGLNNWGIDAYGRYRLFDPMIRDFQ